MFYIINLCVFFFFVVCREQIPGLLHKRDRGRPTEAQAEIKHKSYGELDALDHIPGSEALLKKAKTVSCVVMDPYSFGLISDVSCGAIQIDLDDSDAESNDDTDSDDDQWVDVKHDEDNADGEDEEEVDGEDDEDDEDDEEDDEDDDDEDAEEDADASMQSADGAPAAAASNITLLDEKQAAQELALTRLFTDDDFKRIDAENIKKHTQNARKRPVEAEKSEYVRLDDIEMIFKKRKTDKLARLETVMKGRTGRDRFGYKDGRQNIHCSKTNSEKTKKKNFGMMRHKARSKVKRSFKDKQLDMRKHLLKQKKMK